MSISSSLGTAIIGGFLALGGASGAAVTALEMSVNDVAGSVSTAAAGSISTPMRPISTSTTPRPLDSKEG